MMGVRPMIEVARIFTEEKPLVNLEVASQMYTAGPYFLAKTLFDIPILTLQLIVFTGIMYPLAGLQSARIGVYFLALLLTATTAQSCGLLLGASVADEKLLMLLAPVLFFPIFLFSGLLSINVPTGVAWIEYLVFYKYSVILFTNNEFHGLNITLGAGGGRSAGTAADAMPGMISHSEPTMSGDDFLQILGVNDVSVPAAWAILLAICVGFRLLAFVALSLRLRRRMA
jgi:hypothetical protein